MRAIALVLLSCGLVLAQDPAPSSPAPAEVPADAYALVDGEPILRAAVDAAAAEAGYPAEVLLESMIEARVIERALQAAGHDPSDVSAAPSFFMKVCSRVLLPHE